MNNLHLEYIGKGSDSRVFGLLPEKESIIKIYPRIPPNLIRAYHHSQTTWANILDSDLELATIKLRNKPLDWTIPGFTQAISAIHLRILRLIDEAEVLDIPPGSYNPHISDAMGQKITETILISKESSVVKVPYVGGARLIEVDTYGTYIELVNDKISRTLLPVNLTAENIRIGACDPVSGTVEFIITDTGTSVARLVGVSSF